MRLFVFAIAVLVLIAAPVMAQQPNNGGGHVFGSANCKPRYQCSDVGNISFDTLIADANECMMAYFGYNQPDGMFQDTGSLDANNCLTAKPNVISKGMGAQLSPQCCVISQDSNGDICNLRCDLVTVH